MDNVILDPVAIDDMLNSPDGVCAPMLLDLAERAALVAKAKVRTRTTWGRSDSRSPGFTRPLIHPHLGWSGGHIWSSANAPADPAIFLEYPAEQIRKNEPEGFPFLTTGLWSLEGEV